MNWQKNAWRLIFPGIWRQNCWHKLTWGFYFLFLVQVEFNRIFYKFQIFDSRDGNTAEPNNNLSTPVMDINEIETRKDCVNNSVYTSSMVLFCWQMFTFLLLSNISYCIFTIEIIYQPNVCETGFYLFRYFFTSQTFRHILIQKQCNTCVDEYIGNECFFLVFDA